MDTTLTDPLVGRVLDRRYRVEERLARGGMATVYLATDTRLDRRVAVKVMHPAYAADPEFVNRFIREARAAAGLSHPNVVNVFDQGADGDAVFLVMEYVAGRTLRDLLRERGQLSPAQALSVLEPVLAALEAAHTAGIVHRDIKPENVLLATNGRIKVADFGLARAVEAATVAASSGLLIGTVAYLAPEHFTGEPVDARSDVYAAGIVLFEMLVGGPPFAADSPMAVAFRHVHEDVPAPSTRVAGLPEPLDDLVARATARTPADRYPDARAFLTDVRRTRPGLPPDPPGDDLAGATWPLHDTKILGSAGGYPMLMTRPDPAGPATVPGPPTAQQTPRRRRWGRWASALVLVATLLAGAAGWWFAAGRFVPAPGVLDANPAAATQMLARAGLHPHWLAPRFNPTVVAGRVAYENPAPGGRVVRGGVVTLALSKGPEVHRLPDLAGQTLAAASAVLARDHVRRTVVPAWSDTVVAGLVISTNPVPGTMLHPGDLVTVAVSRGRQPITVPSVVGVPLPQATTMLSQAGFSVTTTTAYSNTVPQGSVIAQNPKAGVTALHGSSIRLTVSKGPRLVAVPNVTGLRVSDARRQLTADGFQVQVYGFGTVVGQSPGAGARVPPGTTISIAAL